jgi:hypothetical protein
MISVTHFTFQSFRGSDFVVIKPVVGDNSNEPEECATDKKESVARAF